MIACTIWHKSKDRFTGIMANNGDILNAGKALVENYKSNDAVAELMQHGSMEKIGPTIKDCIQYQNGKEMIFRSLPFNQMKLVVQEYTNGAYVYIFDEDTNQWWFGLKMKLPLLHAIR